MKTTLNAPSIVLIVADFDVNTVSREERNEARRNINNKTARVVAGNGG